MKLSNKILFIAFLMLCMFISDYGLQAEKSKSNVIEDIVEHKDFKKLLKTKTNILVCFVSSTGPKVTSVLKAFRDAADIIKGHGTMVVIQCYGNAKKLCRILKVNENTQFQIKHYKDGDFHKDYDRKLLPSSFVNFMRDPTGGLPWEEDPSSSDVVHLAGSKLFSRFLKKGSVLNRPLLVVFYAPWCSYCVSMKPEVAAAATDLKGKAFVAAFDTSKSENLEIAHQFNITTLPTLLYFENGKYKFPYEGDNTRSAILDFMLDPRPIEKIPLKSKLVNEMDWSLMESDIVHLTSDSFETTLKEEESALVLFYAPWCGHCKKIKPEYEKAATYMKEYGVSGMLAAVDATKEPGLGTKFGVKGYPTLKYFSNGDFQYDVSVREEAKIIEFMKDPKEPVTPQPEPMWPEPNPVVLLQNDNFRSTLKKKKNALVMFYAPWCGHCKNLKPLIVKLAEHYSEEPRTLIAAVDCTEQQTVCSENSVKGYPTIIYFSYYDKLKVDYTGSRTLSDLISFINDPSAPPTVPKTPTLTKYEAEVMSLTDANFKKAVSSSKPTLVMFYAPWCGHCTVTKPLFEEAAKAIEAEHIPASLRILDSTEHSTTSSLYKIVSFPTFKLFQNGEFVFDYKGDRTKEAFIKFIKNYLTVKTEL